MKREETMSLQRRYFPSITILVAAAAPLAFGQAAAPAVSSTEGAAAVPDLSGIWVHSIPGFEPLAAGPTSLVNRSRRNGISNLLELVGDYTNPILKPEAAEIREEARRNLVKGHRLSHSAHP